MSAIYHESELPSIFPVAPALSFFEQRIAEQQYLHTYFVKLGNGWYQHKELTFQAPFWDSGHLEKFHQLKRPTVLFGVSW